VTKTLESPVVHEISAAEGAIQVKATFTPGYINGLLIEERWPQSLGEDESDMHSVVFSELADYELGLERGVREANQSWIDAVVSPNGPSLEDNTVLAPQQFGGFMRGLGFALNTRGEIANGVITKVRQYSYPSIQRANDVIDFLNGAFEEEGQFEFVPFAGGQYTAEEFMRSFVAGKVPISIQHPYDLHDLSDHVIGWIGLAPDFVRTFQARIGVYLERLEAEHEVEPNLDFVAISDKSINPKRLERLQEFFLPSLAVLKAAMGSIDALTADITDTALTNLGVTGFSDLGTVMGTRLAEAFHMYRSHGGGNELPRGLLGTISKGQAQQFGAQTHLRFQKADELETAKQKP